MHRLFSLGSSRSIKCAGFVFLVIGRVKIRRFGCEIPQRRYPPSYTQAWPFPGSCCPDRRSDRTWSGYPMRLACWYSACVKGSFCQPPLHLHQVFQLGQEPKVNFRHCHRDRTSGHAPLAWPQTLRTAARRRTSSDFWLRISVVRQRHQLVHGSGCPGRFHAPRTAFMMCLLKGLAPMAITSPVAFI